MLTLLLTIREIFINSCLIPQSMNLHILRERLIESGLSVFTIKDIARLLDTSERAASVYAHRLKKSGMANSVEKGKLSITDDPFVVATQVSIPSYLSFTSAFYLRGRLDQVVNRLYVVSSRRRKELVFMNTPMKFVVFPPERVFGYGKIRKGNSYTVVADLEKAAVDSLYRSGYATISTVVEALSAGFDLELLEKYALMMDSEAALRRTGYIIELLGEETSLKPSTATTYYLNPQADSKGEYSSKWRMYINEVLG